MQKNELQFWEELYVAAVLETDPAKVAARIDQAQDALRERWQILCQAPRARDRERQRVEDAMRRRQQLRPVILGGVKGSVGSVRAIYRETVSCISQRTSAGRR